MCKWEYKDSRFFEIPTCAYGFTYKVELCIDEKVFKYYGKKSFGKRWQLYNTSSELVKDLLCIGAESKWEVMDFYYDSSELSSAEALLLKSIKHEHDYEMWLNRCFTSVPESHKHIVTSYNNWFNQYRKLIPYLECYDDDDAWYENFMKDYPV